MEGLAPAPRPRVLLVEDDAPIRQFVAMALEALAIDLVECPTLQAARHALGQGPAALVLLDLMLPDGSGLELLHDATTRQRAGKARWVVFSAGLTARAQEQLALSGVHRVLQKPVGLRALQSCVEEMLRANGPPAADTARVLVDDGITPDRQALARIDGTPQAEEDAVREYFDGRLDLFARVKTHAGTRLAADIAAGDAALARGDASALLVVAHGLKSVMRMLGRPTTAELAQALELAARTERREAWDPLWQALRQALAGTPLA